MTTAEKLEKLYEKASHMHQYFLNWRYKILAGYIVITSAIGYFIFTWVLNPDNFSESRYIFTCLAGITVTIIFFFLNYRISELIWRCQNQAYLLEKDLLFNSEDVCKPEMRGVYSTIVNAKVRERLDKGIYGNKITLINFPGQFNPRHHFGALNLFFIIVFIAQIWMIASRL